jgi:uncharacterized protein
VTGTPDPPSSLTGYPVSAPPLPRPVFFGQHWADAAFIHWPVHPDRVAQLYPQGTRPDVFADGLTYVGLVPFAVRRTAVGAALMLPYFGSFAETNIRLYTTDDADRHGVLFRSLETSRLAVVPLTRIGLGVPYTWARMRIDRSGDVMTYDSVRRWPRRGLRSRLSIRIGRRVDATPLETWLTARWGAHTRKAGRTWWIPNDHEPWPLHAADIVDLEDDLLAASGVVPAGDRLRALFSPGVHVRFGRPTPVN